PQRQGTPGDGVGATAVSGPRETTEKETVETTSLYRLRRDGIVSLSSLSGLVWLNLRVIIVEWMNQRTRIKLRPLSILSIKICGI
ncbi:MAG: hypothetical protein RXN82_05495, partial [Caldivirga sp.]